MKKNGISKKFVMYFIMIIMLINLSACSSDSEEVYTSNIQVNYEADELINVDDMKRDLEFIKSNIEEIHPNPYNEIYEKEFEEKWNSIIGRVTDSMKYKDFYFLVQEALSISADSSTTAYFNKDKEEIPLDIIWTNHGVWVNEDNGYLKTGDVILKIGNKTMDEILESLKVIIPSQNKYWVMNKGKNLLKSRHVLEKLGLVEKTGRVKIEVIGEGNDNKVVYQYFEDKVVKENEVDFTYDVLPNRGFGILKLNRCVNNEEFKNLLKDFFNEVNNNDVKSIILDLRENIGGDISVLDEILKYVEVDKYNGYNIKLNKSEAAKSNGLKGKSIFGKLFSGNKIKVKHDLKELYNGNISVMTSNNTLRDGKNIAVIIKDNNMGNIFGDCTGDAPNGFGKPIELTSPNTGLKFSVSTSTYERPKNDEILEDTLWPDVHAAYTQFDIIQGNDPVLKAVEQYINEQDENTN